MRARVHTLEASAAEYEAGWRIVRDDLLPWARESTGYCGSIGLVDRERGKALLITLWTDDETRAASADAAERLSGLASEASGARRGPVERYDVEFVDLIAGSSG